MTNVNEIRVWDPLVRLCHWSLVVAFTFAYLSGEVESPLHEWAGYAVLALLSIRTAWGFVGSRHARFGDFVFSPHTVIGYTLDLMRGQARRYLGHNPLGGWMVVALLVTLTLSSVTGILALYPPLVLRALAPLASAHANGDDDELESANEWLGELHEVLSHVALVLVVLHVLGVLFSSLVHRENLVRAMITGRKRA
jgi:cytochrome b